MAAALEQRDPPAFDRADDQPPGVALDARHGKAGDVGVGDRDRVARFVGERAEAGAEHDRRAAAGSRGRGPSARRSRRPKSCPSIPPRSALLKFATNCRRAVERRHFAVADRHSRLLGTAFACRETEQGCGERARSRQNARSRRIALTRRSVLPLLRGRSELILSIWREVIELAAQGELTRALSRNALFAALGYMQCIILRRRNHVAASSTRSARLRQRDEASRVLARCASTAEGSRLASAEPIAVRRQLICEDLADCRCSDRCEHSRRRARDELCGQAIEPCQSSITPCGTIRRQCFASVSVVQHLKMLQLGNAASMSRSSQRPDCE